jgi:hypothetical protein
MLSVLSEKAENSERDHRGGAKNTKNPLSVRATSWRPCLRVDGVPWPPSSPASAEATARLAEAPTAQAAVQADGLERSWSLNVELGPDLAAVDRQRETEAPEHGAHATIVYHG